MSNQVEIVVTSKDKTRQGFDSAKKQGTSFGGVMGKIGGAAGGFLAANFVAGVGTKVVDFFTTSTNAAKDLGESVSKNNAVFGSQAGAISAWAAGGAQSFGLSKAAALDAAGGFGNMFNQLGIGTAKSAQMSQGIVQLAGDFASFHNADISEVVDAQSAAFRGEYDSLQKFLPLINAASVEQEALAMTGKKSTKELTAQEKALAVNALMYKGAGKARGDFARTADQAANAERIAAAETANLNAEIGTKLLPVSMKITQIKLQLARVLMGQVLPALMALGSWIGANKQLLLAIGIGIAAVLVPAFIAWAVAAGAAAAATIVAAAPLILVGLAVAALAFLIIKNWDKIKAATAAVWAWLRSATSAAWNGVKAVVSAVASAISGVIRAYFNAYKTIILAVWNAIRSGASAAWNGIRAVVSGAINAVRSVISSGFNAIRSVVSAAWNGIRNAVSAGINAVVSLARSIGGRIRAAVGNLGSLLYNAGYSLIMGLVNGIRGSIGAAVNAARSVVSSAVNAAKSALGISSPSKVFQVIGQQVGEGLTGGMDGKRRDASSSGHSLAMAAISRVGGNLNIGGGSSRGPAGGLILEIQSGGSRLDDLLVELLRKAVRSRGGDVQTALGT